jgi:uncharacterized membrane protein HdeD (DUF308 family)
MLTDDLRRRYSLTKWALIIRGLVALAAGIYIFGRLSASLSWLTLIVALWAFLDGVTNVSRAFAVRRIASHWWVFLVAGLVGVIFGVATINRYPNISLLFASGWTAVWLFTAGGAAFYLAARERGIHIPSAFASTFGAVCLIAGGLVVLHPEWTMRVVAEFAVIGGLIMLAAAFRLGRLERRLETAAETQAPMSHRRDSRAA